MAKTKKYKKESTIIIALVFITVLSALFIKRDVIFKSNSDMLQLPAVNVPMQASDGSVHHLSANFYIDIMDHSKDIPLDKITADISELLSKTNYDLLAEKDSLNSVMNSIQDQIKSKYPDITINHVYVSNFLTDFKLSEPTNSSNSKNNILNGLQFKK